ncbi:MAG: SprB repeat-containing protein [Flavobacteriales bacterium]|nr:SprB repeat-containing protein [Flavobacteriales bacterium]
MRSPICSLFPVLLLLCALDAQAGIIFIQANSSCGNPTGFLKAIPNGGVAPYTFSWSTGAQIDSIGGLIGGTGQWYVVTVTDALLQVQMDSAQVVDLPYLEIAGVTSYIVNNYGLSQQMPMHPCPGQCNGGLVVHREYINGAAPLFASFDLGGFLFNDDIGNPVFGGFCNGDMVTLTVSDAFGCIGTSQEQITGPIGNSISVVQVNGACAGQANGSVDLIADQNEIVWVQYVEVLNDAQQVIEFLTNFDLYDTATVTGLAPGNYAARVHWGPVDPACTEDHPFTVPDLGLVCGNVSGTLFIDHDQDCTQDANDPGIPYRVLTINPGPVNAITDATGHYTRNLFSGNYDIAATGTDLLQLCPVASPVPFAIPGGGSVVVDIADSSTIDLDLEVIAYHLPARPGFTNPAHGWVRNLSGQQSGAVTVTVTFDPVFTMVNTYPTATSVVGNVITWDLPALNSFEQVGVWAYLSLPPDVGLIGTPFTNTITCSNTLGDAVPANNTTSDDDFITGSFDPNDKAVRTSSGQNNSQFLLEADEWLDYTIRFQNTGTDTAFTVVLVDTLDADLDIATLELRFASHFFIPEFTADRVLRFTFPNILLPDSNVNEALSHGFLAYRIRPNTTAMPGTLLSNFADIFFDFNPPVRTNTTEVTVETITSIAYAQGSSLRAYPNPTDGRTMLRFEDRVPGLRSIRVWAVDGSLLRHFNVSGNEVLVPLDLGALAPGIYRVQCSGGNERTNMAVVKQ